MKEKYELCVEGSFSAAHILRGYDGNCSTIHGHNWVVEIFVVCEKLNDLDLGIDFRELKKILREELYYLDHKNISELAEFTRKNASSEALARHFFVRLKPKIQSGHCTLSKVTITETPGCRVTYSEE